MKTHWNFEYDGEMHDIEADTKEAAAQWADEWWNERHEEERGTVEDEGFLVEFNYDVDGDPEEVQRLKHYLVFEYYHGDYAEHNVWHSGGGGVL